MGFISSSTRTKLYSIFKHTLAKNPITQSSNLANKSKLSGSIRNNPPTLLFSRAHKRVHHSGTNLGFTHLRNCHNGHGTQHNTNFIQYAIRKWDSWNLTHKLYNSMIGVGILGWLYLCNWETVPYTNRKHYIAKSDLCDHLVDSEWDETCDPEFMEGILTENNPTSQRVFRITKDLLRNLEKDLKLSDGSINLKYGSSFLSSKRKVEKVQNWLQRRRERKSGKYHLDGLRWRVMVVDCPKQVACCIQNGKIIVPTHLLQLCETDDDIATLIAHQVGHVVARHSMEKLMINHKILSVLFVLNLGILIPFLNWWYLDWRKARIDYPIIRRLEAEADRIGMMLMASAGYDPRKVPDVYIKLYGDEQIPIYHTAKKRAEMLSKESIMQEAVALYNKAISESKQDNQN